MLNITQCRKTLQKHGIYLTQNDLNEVKHFLEYWVKIQIQEENNNNFKNLN